MHNMLIYLKHMSNKKQTMMSAFFSISQEQKPEAAMAKFTGQNSTVKNLFLLRDTQIDRIWVRMWHHYYKSTYIVSTVLSGDSGVIVWGNVFFCYSGLLILLYRRMNVTVDLISIYI